MGSFFFFPPVCTVVLADPGSGVTTLAARSTMPAPEVEAGGGIESLSEVDRTMDMDDESGFPDVEPEESGKMVVEARGEE